MKLLRTNVRIDPKDSLGQGLDATFTLMLFVGIGFALDRWLGTLPIMMIVMTFVASIGLYYRLKNGYEAKMQLLDDQRRARAAARTGSPTPTLTPTPPPTSVAAPLTGDSGEPT